MTIATTLSRRAFVVSVMAVGGGLALSVGRANAAADLKQPWGVPTPATDSEFTAWLTIAPDDTVTVRVPTPEIGNGVMTQHCMTVAEELASAWPTMRAEFAPTDRNFLEDEVYSKSAGFLGYFSGRSTGPSRMRILLQAGASARERLRAAAAQAWKVPVAEVEAKDSVLTHKPSGRTLRYGAVAARAAKIKLDKEPDLKPQAEWTFLGKATPGKLNNKAIVTGQATFGMDVRLPNMLYAALMQSPVHGGKLKSYDFEAIRAMPGVHSVVVVDPSEPRKPTNLKPPIPLGSSVAQSAVAVVADHYWQARKALEALPVVWDDGDGAQWKTTEQVHAAALAACETPAETPEKSLGDAPGILAQPGGIKVEAAYLTPYCDHVNMEPLNGTALVTADRVEVWHPSQHTQLGFVVAVEESGMAPQNVHVHQTYVGGGFGRRVFNDDLRMVVAVAKKVPGRPVHVIWSREESMRQGRYRAMEATKLTAKLGPDGMPVAILARCAGHGHSTNGLANAVWTSGPIPNVQVESKTLPLHILTGPYRGPGYNSNAFFLESFIDECAAAAKIDPLAYRLKLLANWPDPGWALCLNEVARKSGWGQALPRGEGRGIAIANWGMDGKPNAGTTVAAVVRVAVTPQGELTVKQIDTAFDCGRTLNRDAALAQVEGGTVYGLNMSLNEALTIENGRIVEGNFHEYPMLRMADIPDIRPHAGGLSGAERFNELGEPPVGPIGPAIANAIFAATGKRIRQTPFRNQDLKWT